ncbi:hypothetical protein [Mobilicoccus sp.]|uniref:hypothetical protein n=1 Tax=Mobilicoccus sp. TaxID=2034349 RepID=UPI0028B24520|nr:hypothetical protein [Mobilicoccus sp.]
MGKSAYLSVCDDLDAIRRSAAPDIDLAPCLARFLAACSGTLRGAASSAARVDRTDRALHDTRVGACDAGGPR